MRENLGRNGRVSKGLKAAFAALVAALAVGAFGVANANAAQELELSFNDSWIAVDALGEDGSFHAIDPSDPDPITIDLKGTLATDGAFNAPKEAFDFPDQEIDAGEEFGVITLKIAAVDTITGNYDQATGAFNAQLPLSLTVVLPGLAACQISPLNIPLASSGTRVFDTESKSGAPFVSGTGALLGSWTGVTVENVRDVDEATGEDLDPQTGLCAGLIGLIMDAQEIDSFDGSIWLGGTAKVTGTPECPAGTVGTYPNCEQPKCPEGTTGTPPNCEKVVPPVRRANIARVAVSRAVVRPGGRARIRVTVVNRGNAAFRGPVRLRSSNRHVRVPQRFRIAVGPKKRASKVIVVRTTRRARGRARIIAAVANKRGAGIVAVRAAQRRRR